VARQEQSEGAEPYLSAEVQGSTDAQQSPIGSGWHTLNVTFGLRVATSTSEDRERFAECVHDLQHNIALVSEAIE